MASRTVVEFPVASDPWPTIDTWAAATGHRLVQHGDWGRSYERGDGFLVARSYVQIARSAAGLRIESWMIVWFTGGEMDLAGGDPIQYFPRRKARGILNQLLAALGQTAVK